MKTPNNQALSRALMLFLAACAAVVLTACVSTTNRPERPKSDDDAAKELTRRADIRVELAANYLLQRRVAVAIEESQAALKIKPDHAPAYNMLGLIYMELDDQPKAEENFRRAMQLAPRDPNINLNYGWFMCQTGRARESIPLFMVAASDRLYEAPAKAYQNAGVCSRRAGRDGDAEANFRRALEIDPTNQVSLFNLGEMFLARNMLAEANAMSQRLSNLAITPDSLWLAIRIQRKLGDTAQVNSLATQLRRRFPESRELQLFIQGRYE